MSTFSATAPTTMSAASTAEALISAQRPLGIAEWVALTPDQWVRLTALEHYDLWFVVERLCSKQLIRAELIDLAVSEFRRYIALIVLGNQGVQMFNADTDEVWHQLILFTREYARFCAVVCGDFIHHTPFTSRGTPEPNGRERVYELYLYTFGELNREW